MCLHGLGRPATEGPFLLRSLERGKRLAIDGSEKSFALPGSEGEPIDGLVRHNPDQSCVITRAQSVFGLFKAAGELFRNLACFSIDHRPLRRPNPIGVDRTFEHVIGLGSDTFAFTPR